MGSINERDIQEYFRLLEKKFDIVHFDLPESKYENGNISFFETVIICMLMKNINPKKVLEFGTFNGRTTVNIAANIPPDGSVITVDLPKENMKNTRFALEGVNPDDQHDELGYVGKTTKLYQRHDRYRSKIVQFWMDTAEFPIKKYPEYFDFIFVDASHTYENCLNDSKNAMYCIKDDGFILWHDYNGWPGVTQALNEIYNESQEYYSFTHIKGTSMVLYHADIR